MEIQEYFNIRIITKLLKYKKTNGGELEDLILSNTKDDFLFKSNELISKCIFINKIVEYLKSIYIKNKNSKVNFCIEEISRDSHQCLICDEIYKNFDNIEEIFDIISDYVKRLLKYNKEIQSTSLKPKISNKKGKKIERVLIPSQFENTFVKNIIGFLFINLNEKNIEKLTYILSFSDGKNSCSSDEFIKKIVLIFENCKFINTIKDLINQDDYETIIEKMKVFKNEDCNLCVMLNDLFKTSNNITEFLDLFKIDNMKKKEEDSNYLLKGNYSTRKFTIFRWHVDGKYNQWNYLFQNIENFRLLKQKDFFIKLIGIVRYFMLPLIFYKDNPHNYSICNYQKLCEMPIKEWNKYSKKHVEKFFTLKNLKLHLIDVSEYHKTYVDLLKSYKEIIQTKTGHTQYVYNYIMNVDYNNPIECFLAFHLKLNEDCKELLQVFYTLNSMNKNTTLKDFANKDKLLFLNDMLAKIIQRWINIDKDRIRIFSQLNPKSIDIDNEYNMSYLYDIDEIVYEVLNDDLDDDLNIEINEDINEEEYSPETVQRMIDELKI